jgi:adenylate kinase
MAAAALPALLARLPALPRRLLPPHRTLAAAAAASAAAAAPLSQAPPKRARYTASVAGQASSAGRTSPIATTAAAATAGEPTTAAAMTTGKTSSTEAATAAAGKGAGAAFEGALRRLAGEWDVGLEGCRAGQGRRALVFPKECIFLNGAPGSGKSSNARFMLAARGLGPRQQVVMSELLEHDARFRARMDAGGLIEDVDVVEALLRELLRPDFGQGVLVDGFPRTAVQADCLNLLRAKMQALRAESVAGLRAAATPDVAALRFPVPRFFVCILHVTRPQSIQRQLQRGRDAVAHNARVRAAGTGELAVERKTDFDPRLLAERYAVFERHRDTLSKLMRHFPFKVIDAGQPIGSVREEILREFQYQSKNDLSRAAFDAIQPVPLASRVGSNARPDLCQRLDEYTSFFPERFARAVALVTAAIVPRLRDAAFAGDAIVRFPPESPQHAELSRPDGASFRQMVLDCLAERGFAPHYDAEVTLVPARFDLSSGAIACSRRVVHVFHVKFPAALLSHQNIRALNEHREMEEPLYDRGDGDR